MLLLLFSFCFVFFFALLHCYLSAVDIEITCPASGFKVGETATVTCEVNKTAFAGHCKLPATFITFYFTPSSGSQTEWCSSKFKGCDNAGTSQVACGKCNCGCEKANDAFTFHRLDFVPTLAHTAGNFTCEVICFHTTTLPPLVDNNCQHVTVGKLIVTHSSFTTSWWHA